MAKLRGVGDRFWTHSASQNRLRIREVEQAPDGSIWLLEDTPGGRLLRLAPPS